MGGNVQITGVPTTPGPDGSVPLRREIRDLQKNYPEQFNLFILGMQQYEATDEKSLTSYYQVAGIHGMPFKAWDGVQGIQDWQFGGYCTHSSVLFIPWHRPYLALFEQILYSIVQDLSHKFPESLRSRYVTAAQTFRLPYWDWAQNISPDFPASMSGELISIVDTDGTTKSIANPLYQFNFHPVNPAPEDFDAQWSRDSTTLRYPLRGKSRDSMVTRVMANESASLRSNVSLILLSYTDFDAFSNNQWNSGNQTGTYGSLEDLHNEIHDKTGGPSGHMGALEVSAFDPLFWLHHCNVDRLWSLWQALNPDSYIDPQPAPTSTFTTEAGTTESADSALTPFWDTTGTDFWKASQVITSTTFGYSYPETQSWNYKSGDEYKQALRKTISTLYGSNVFQNFAASAATEVLAAVPWVAVNATAIKPAAKGVAANSLVINDKAENGKPANGVVVHVAEVSSDEPAVHEILPEGEQEAQMPLPTVSGVADDSQPIPAALQHLAPDNKYTEWIVNVRAQKHGLGQTFRVLVFLGPFGSDPAEWDVEYNCVGRVSVLGRSSSTRCSKCQTDHERGLVVSGTVPLTSALLQDVLAGRVSGLDALAVVPYLTDNLNWRVTMFDGAEMDIAQVPGLKVSVSSTEVTIGSDGIPIYSGEYVVHPEITAGQTSGEGNQAE